VTEKLYLPPFRVIGFAVMVFGAMTITSFDCDTQVQKVLNQVFLG
jgi:hypothetical protein